MNRKFEVIALTFVLLLSRPLLSEEKHEHEAQAEAGHAHEEEDENPAVGPDKGITETDHEKGFKLSPEAVKRFGITSRTVVSSQAVSLPKSAIFFGLQERNIFRERAGFYRRVDFKTISKSAGEYTISSDDLIAGDRVVITGIGFLRIAEIASEGGGAVGHSH
jgi:hypothetical protein